MVVQRSPPRAQETNARPEHQDPEDLEELSEAKSQTPENPGRETPRPENPVPELDPTIEAALAQLQANFS